MLNIENEITWEEVQKRWNPSEYTLVDIREAEAFSYGSIPGALNIPETVLRERHNEINQNLPLVVYCKGGMVSQEVVLWLLEQGYTAYNLSGGYHAWLAVNLDQDVKALEDIEKGIRKKFHKSLFSRFAKAINEYELIQENDKIAVCISGGKDSMLMAKLFQELKRHNKFHFELEFLVMDPGYSPINRQVIENNARLLGVPVTIFDTNIFDAVFEVEKSPCYLCARMRRGHLYRKAQELGCNKIALGHHYDDVIETILMGMMYGAQIQTMMPKLHSTNFEGMELIRPMYLIREEDVKHWRDYNGLRFIQCACRFTDNCTFCNSDGIAKSKRQEIKQLIASLKKINPYIEGNIFRSIENVNLSTVVAYKKDGVQHHFLENYNDRK